MLVIFNSTDDLLKSDNPYFAGIISCNYQSELKLNEVLMIPKSSFLEFALLYISNGLFHPKYKRNGFHFDVYSNVFLFGWRYSP